MLLSMCILKEDSVNYYLFYAHYLPDSPVSYLHVFSSLNVTLPLGGEYSQNSHLNDEETETHRG